MRGSRRHLLIATAFALPCAVRCAQEFEPPPAESTVASLRPDQAAGADWQVQDPAYSDGLMHRYVVHSRFGDFPAYGPGALRTRLQEVAALATIEHTSSS